MCGIAGYFLKTPIDPQVDQVERFLESIGKRGPDDEGVCLISRGTKTYQSYKTDRTYTALGTLPHIQNSRGMKHDLALFHTRYAILDLSEKGHQPFISQDQSCIAIFNGEIYNYIELRQELVSLGVNFRTHCDTEVLVEGYARYKDDFFSKMNGFWAVAIYDREKDSLVLSRDRAGVAPLYYRETSQGLFFSSYIASLIEIDHQKASINEDVQLGFLQTGLKDLDGATYYQEIKSLPEASTVHLSSSKPFVSQAELKKYWSLPSSRLSEQDISFDDALKKFRELLFSAVEIRLRADVKVAFELSGGLDSSSVVAAAASLSKSPLSTYTAKIKGADEEPFARSMLKKYQLDYHVIDRIEDRFIQDYQSFSQLMEEPYDNPNAYTHYQMLKIMKKEGVKVIITGAGGDEVLAGYEASFWPKAYEEWRKEGLGAWLKADWYEFCRRFRTPKNSYGTLKHYLVDSFRKFKPSSGIDHSPHPTKMTTALKYHQEYGRLSFDQQRRFHFIKALLPFYMRSSDHFAMGIPIEHRFPLLDYRLIEFGLQLPISFLFRNGWTKYILRKAMEPYLPSKILWRRQKMGFQFPYCSYFSEHRPTFEPVLMKYFRELPYEDLLKKDPILLWRYLSTSIWMDNNKC
jgi:asparagine synthase (glutamine-hydrolysing)